MKQAKASRKEVENLTRWLEKMEQRGELVPHWRRTVHGYLVMLDNCCDPDLDYLEWKPEYKAMIEARETKVGEEVIAIPNKIEEPK